MQFQNHYQWQKYIEKLQQELQQMPLPLVQEIGDIVKNILEEGKCVEALGYPPFLESEKALGKVNAIKAYKLRVGKSLLECLARWKLEEREKLLSR